VSYWRGERRVDIRQYSPTGAPTKFGVSLKPQQFKKLFYANQAISRDVETLCNKQEHVESKFDLGDNLTVTLTSPYKCVNIRKWWIHQVTKECLPAKFGLTLKPNQWRKLSEFLEEINSTFDDLRNISLCDGDHEDEMQRFLCFECNNNSLRPVSDMLN
jgi:hypothetical protein